MHIEDPQINFNKQKKAAKKAGNFRLDPTPIQPESLDALEITVSSRLSALEKMLAKFLASHPIMDSKVAIADFEKITNNRCKIEFELIDIVKDFGNEGLVRIRKTTGAQERKVEKSTLEIASERRKEDLRFRIVLFSFLHSLCGKILTESSVGKKSENKNKNENNAGLSEIQQYLAMSIIKDPKEKYPLFNETSNRLKKLYNLTPKQEGEITGGVLGLAGAYHYYRSRGFKVLFPEPRTDASKATDLFLVKWGMLMPNEKDILNSKGIEAINSLPEEIREQVFKIQVKCHLNSRIPTSEMIYDFQLNKAYDDEAAYINGGLDKYSISDYDYRPNEDYLFFKNQCQTLTHGRYLDIRIEDARAYFEKKEDK